MPQDDDIERLLAEIDSMNDAEQPPAQPAKGKPPARPAAESKEVAQTSEGSSRVTWALMAAAGSGAIGALVGLILVVLPWIDPISTGLGAALGGMIAALVSGPPKWMKD